jgi:hypothetical protein
VVTTRPASTGECLWGKGYLGSMRSAERMDRATSWRSIGRWYGHLNVVQIVGVYREKRGKWGAAAFYYLCHQRVGQGGDLELYWKCTGGSGLGERERRGLHRVSSKILAPAMHVSPPNRKGQEQHCSSDGGRPERAG